jgi:hypothetical protein
MGGLAGPVGLDAADGLGGGPPDGPDVLVVQVDGDDLGGDVDGDDLPGVDPAQGDLLPGDHDDAGVAWSQVSGLGLVCSSSRDCGSKNIIVASSIRMLIAEQLTQRGVHWRAHRGPSGDCGLLGGPGPSRMRTLFTLAD